MNLDNLHEQNERIAADLINKILLKLIADPSDDYLVAMNKRAGDLVRICLKGIADINDGRVKREQIELAKRAAEATGVDIEYDISELLPTENE